MIVNNVEKMKSKMATTIYTMAKCNCGGTCPNVCMPSCASCANCQSRCKIHQFDNDNNYVRGVYTN